MSNAVELRKQWMREMGMPEEEIEQNLFDVGTEEEEMEHVKAGQRIREININYEQLVQAVRRRKQR